MHHEEPAFLTIRPGVEITLSGERYVVTHHLDEATVLARHTETNIVERVRVDRLRPLETRSEGADVAAGPDLTTFDKSQWDLAQQRFEAIRPLLFDSHRTRSRVGQRAEEAGYHVSTVYEWLRAYEETGRISALIPEKRGPDPGGTKLADDVEAIITSAIDDFYLNKQRYTATDVANEVQLRCKRNNLPPPHSNTVRNRIRQVGAQKALSRRGRKDQARDRYEPIRGNFPGAETPLSVVQIDHTQADVIVVDETTREPIGRPWLTLGLDVSTRMVFGMYIGLEEPSAASVGLCITNGMLPKDHYLASMEIDGNWPVWGKPNVFHVDNAKEFRGRVLQTACEQYGINLEMRPVKVPHYGGHIERLMGTTANEIRKLPGATFSNTRDRKGYDSEREAALTLREFEQYLVDFIVNVYHERIHSELDMSPRKAWQLGLMGGSQRPGIGLPAIPADPMRLWLDFMPFVRRSVQRYGIQVEGIHYYHEVLRPWINAKRSHRSDQPREFVIRQDPRDISVVYFFDPDQETYYAIPYRDPRHPAISVWEMRAAKKKLKDEGRANVDEDAIFEAIERMRGRVDEAKRKTKALRRKGRSRKAPSRVSKSDPAPVEGESLEVTRRSTVPSEPPPDLFDREIEPFGEED